LHRLEKKHQKEYEEFTEKHKKSLDNFLEKERSKDASTQSWEVSNISFFAPLHKRISVTEKQMYFIMAK